MATESKDVERISSGFIKSELLANFSNALQNKVLYVKDAAGNYVEALPHSSIANDGFFIKKQTVKKLLAAIEKKRSGCVLVNFVIGPSAVQGQQLQLMFTAVESIRMVEPGDLGELCLSTAKTKGESTEPPTSGVPHPHPPRPAEG